MELRSLPLRVSMAAASAAAAAAAAAGSTSGALLPDQDDYRWVALKRWLENELSNFRSPRMTEITAQARKLGMSSKRARDLVNANVPSYRQTLSKVYTTADRPSKIYAGQTLGVLAADVAFFAKMSRLRGEIGAAPSSQSAACLVARDIVSRYTYFIPLGKEGKSAKGLEQAFAKLFELHAKHRDYKIKKILFDQEKGMKSTRVQLFLASHNVSLQLFRFSRVKSAFAESTIKIARQTMERWRATEGGSKKSWQQLVGHVAAALNSQPIIIQGKKLSFTPNQITRKTLSKFLAELHALRREYTATFFSLDPEMLEYKYDVGDRVVLKLKSISTKALEKRSVETVDATEWIITKKLAFFSNKMTIIKSYALREATAPPELAEETIREEDALVRIDL